MTCPHCGERIWRWDGNVWTCKNGHHTTIEQPTSEGPPILVDTPRQPVSVRLTIALAAAPLVFLAGFMVEKAVG